MCGIFALYPNKSSRAWIQYVKQALLAVSDRGRDSIGLYLYDTQHKNGTVYRHVGNYQGFIEQTWNDIEYELVHTEYDLIIGVARAQPLQEPISEIDTIPPFITKNNRYVLVHNGIISNDAELKEKLGLSGEFNDSEVMLHWLVKDGPFFPQYINDLKGAAAFLLFDSKKSILYAYRDFKPLSVAQYNQNVLFITTNEMAYTTFGQSSLLAGQKLLGQFSSITVDEMPMYRLFEFGTTNPGNAIQLVNFNDVGRYVVQKTTNLEKTDQKKCIAVCSGGIDSTTAAAIMINKGYQVTFMYFDYGHISLDAEWTAVQNIAVHYGCPSVKIDLTWLGKLGGSALTDQKFILPDGIEGVELVADWVPARNMVMLSVAASYADRFGYKKIVFGANLQENTSPYSDNESVFAHKMNDAVKFGCLNEVDIEAPLEHQMKEDIVRIGTELNVPWILTHSCHRSTLNPKRSHIYDKEIYNGHYLMCGRCSCCYSSALAFKKANIPDTRLVKYEVLGKDISADFARYDNARRSV